MVRCKQPEQEAVQVARLPRLVHVALAEAERTMRHDAMVELWIKDLRLVRSRAVEADAGPCQKLCNVAFETALRHRILGC